MTDHVAKDMFRFLVFVLWWMRRGLQRVVAVEDIAVMFPICLVLALVALYNPTLFPSCDPSSAICDLSVARQRKLNGINGGDSMAYKRVSKAAHMKGCKPELFIVSA